MEGDGGDRRLRAWAVDHGWTTGGVVGLVVVGVLLVVTGSYAEARADIGPTSALISTLLLAALFGFLPGALVGLGVQRGARRSVAGAAPGDPRSGRRSPLPRGASYVIPAGAWRSRYQVCESAALGFHRTVRDLAAGPVRDWVRDVQEQLDAELAAAREIALLGHRVAPFARDRGPGGVAARELWDRLGAAAEAFRAAEQQAVRIRLDAATGPDLTRVRAELDVLVEQLPHLRRDG